MNERIKELVKKAGGKFSIHTLMSYPVQHRESIELWDQNIEKFAELIAIECADIDFRTLGFTHDQVIDVSNLIKQHFGVTK